MTQRRAAIGLTLVELLVTVALIGVAASVVLPLGALAERRAKETQLRAALRGIRQALDAYKAAADTGVIDKPTGSSGYPARLELLAQGVPRSRAMGHAGTPMVFLRQVPRDPFHADPHIAASQTWNIRSYGAAPGDFRAGPDVFDVSSRSAQSGLDGTRLADW